VEADENTRWVQGFFLGYRIDSRLIESPDWPMLNAALNRAGAAGYDVEANLPRLAACCEAAAAPPAARPHPAAQAPPQHPDPPALRSPAAPGPAR